MCSPCYDWEHPSTDSNALPLPPLPRYYTKKNSVQFVAYTGEDERGVGDDLVKLDVGVERNVEVEKRLA